MTTDEIIEKKILEIAQRSVEQVKEIFKGDELKIKMFAAIFQPNFEHLISSMRRTLGSPETEEILEMYLAINKEIDEIAQKLFTH